MMVDSGAARSRATGHMGYAALLASTALAGLLMLHATAGAQTTSQGNPQPSAGSQRAIAFAIAPQALSAAIVLFSRAAGVDLVFDGAIPRDVRTQGVSGSYTLNEALGRLLAGTGFSARLSGPRTVRLVNNAVSNAGVAGAVPAGAIQLDAIDVQGAGEFGPTNGYISQDSIAGSKTDTPIVETPFSVSVVNRQQLDTQNPRSLPDALRYVPGVATGFFGADNRMERGQIYLRGFGDDVSQLYWNGLNLPGDSYVNSPTLEPYTLERIEVLRGPASVLYGQSSPGGIINAVSKRPTETPLHEVVVGTGNYGRIYGAFDLGGPIDQQGQWLYRLTGVGYRTGSQVDDKNYERFSIAPALTWRPTADTKLTILTTYQRDPTGVGFQSLPLKGTLLPGPVGKIPTSFNFGEPSYDRLDRTSGSVGYEFEHRFSDVWTVRQNFRYMHAEGTYREIQPTGDWLPPRGTLQRWNWGTDGRLDAVAVDNQVQANFATGPVAHKVLVGLDYKNQWTRLKHYWGMAGVPPINVLNPIYGLPIPDAPMIVNNKGSLSQVGLYAQDQIAVGNWRFLIGGRQDWAENSSTSLLAAGTPTTTQNDDAFTWRAGGVYLFDNGLAPYASYSTSFQPQGGTDFYNNMFKPTTAQQYEVGIKYQPKGLQSFVQLSLFDLTQQNVVTADPDQEHHPGSSVQTGEVRVQGIELSGMFVINENLNLLASYTYNDIETTKANPDASGFDPTGRVPWYYPEQLASIWADYRFREGFLSGLRLGGGVRYVGSAYNGPRQQHTVPSYTLVDAAISYDFGAATPSLRGWEVGVNVTNLFDKEYLARCSELNCSWGIRRTILANLKYRW